FAPAGVSQRTDHAPCCDLSLPLCCGLDGAACDCAAGASCGVCNCAGACWASEGSVAMASAMLAPVASVARRWLIVRRASMRKVMKSPDRITGTLTRCIGHEKRRDRRFSVLAIIATVIPPVASIVTRHVKGSVLSNHGFIKGFARFSKVFVVGWNNSAMPNNPGHSQFFARLRAKMPHRNI